MSTLGTVVLVVVGFFGMEVVTYLVHRFVMHGFLRSLHVSHHRNAAAAYANKTPEPNDLFPLSFSFIVIIGLWVGFNMSGAAWLLPLLIGVTLYGMVYTVIHDGVIHGRIRWMKKLQTKWTAQLAVAHREHHRVNSEPYGMLFPSLTMQIQPRVNGLTPSHVPVDQ